MHTPLLRFRTLFLLAIGLTGAQLAHAQPATSPSPAHVVSANPFGLMLNWFNAEYEQRVSPSITVGAGGSFLSNNDVDYVNSDAFLRYYPAGAALNGFALGAKAGLTRIDDSCGAYCGRGNTRTAFGIGVDTNYSRVVGKGQHLYVGAGFGLKRLFNAGDSALKVIPTVRIVNVGVAF